MEKSNNPDFLNFFMNNNKLLSVKCTGNLYPQIVNMTLITLSFTDHKSLPV